MIVFRIFQSLLGNLHPKFAGGWSHVPRTSFARTKHFLRQTLWPSVQESIAWFWQRAAQNTFRVFVVPSENPTPHEALSQSIVGLARTGFPFFLLAQTVAESPIRIFPAC